MPQKLSFHFRDDSTRDQPPLLFLHAFPLHGGMWEAQLNVLAAKARCITMDVVGLGRSSHPATPMMLEHLVDDVLQLLDHLHVESATLCGLSMGGYLALRTHERAPERIRSLVLANTQAAADGNEAKLKRADGVRKLRHDGATSFVDGFVNVALSDRTRERHPEVLTRARSLMLDSGVDGMVHALVALSTRTDTTDSLAKIAVPTLVIAGEHDVITPPTVMRAMADKIPNARYEVIAGVGHLSNLEDPERFNQLIGEHLDALG